MGWLDSHHTFSFGHYYDPRYVGFGPLRVINEDRVDAGAGFPPHGHADMEIISYVVAGGLEHRDSTGGGGVVRPGEVQVMTAGRGVRHSEMNASSTEPVHFLQIWIEPAERRTEPRYEDKDFGDERGVVLIVSPDGRDGSLRIGQDAEIRRVVLAAGESVEVPISRARGWVQVVRGTATVDGVAVGPGDGAAITGLDAVTIAPSSDFEALAFDLP